MSLASTLGFSSEKKIRYAIVGLGDIAQEAMMPGVAHTGNSEITALVTGDPEKAEDLGEQYKVPLENRYPYERFAELLKSGKIDAIYLATPNWRHAEFAVPALLAGVHVFLEKPMEINLDRCQEILDAQKTSGAKLMIAYRLHFEPATLATINLIREGELGDLRIFSATFSQRLDPANHRAHNGIEAGPLFDMGPYPINAARYLFGEEPSEVLSATATRDPNSELGDLDDTVAVVLGFPGNRIAQFIVSYAGSTVDSYFIVGTKGSVQLNPGFGFGYGKSLEQFITIGDRKTHKVHKATDQFAGETMYFSNCILNNEEPEPNGEEGYADVRVLEGIVKALETGKTVKLPPFHRGRRINTEAQETKLARKAPPPTVNAANPAQAN